MKQDEWQEVGALHATNEAGELSPKDPVEGREMSGYGIVGGKDNEHVKVRQCLNEAKTNSGTGERCARHGDGSVAPYGH